tara:strand:- start:67 stop:345 length:279 start_codon:yes stop_codon:yes gene_type:complete
MSTSLDKLIANMAGMIKDALAPHPDVELDSPVYSDQQLTKLAENLYLEVVAEYQPEPDVYGLGDDDVEEEWTGDGDEPDFERLAWVWVASDG